MRSRAHIKKFTRLIFIRRAVAMRAKSDKQMICYICTMEKNKSSDEDCLFPSLHATLLHCGTKICSNNTEWMVAVVTFVLEFIFSNLDFYSLVNLFVYLAIMDGKILQFSPQNDDNLSYFSTQHYNDRYSGIGLLSRKQLNHQTFLMFAYFVIFHQLDCFRYWFDSWRKQIWHITWDQVIQPQIEKLLDFKYRTYRCADFFFISCDFIRLLSCVFRLLTAHPCDVDLNIDLYRTFFYENK